MKVAACARYSTVYHLSACRRCSEQLTRSTDGFARRSELLESLRRRQVRLLNTGSVRWQSRFRRCFRERFIRLQHENKMLKLRQGEEVNNEQILILQASCEQLKDQNNQLTNDLW